MKPAPLLLLIVLFASGGDVYGDDCDNWIRVRSDRLSLYTSLSKERANSIAEQLGYFQTAIDVVTGTRRTHPLAQNVFVLSENIWTQRFSVVAPAAIREGMFDSALVMLDPTRARTNPYSVAMHDYVRNVLRDSGGFHYPRWYREGFVDLLTASSQDETTFSVGLLREERIKAVTTPSSWVPLRDLMAAKFDEDSYRSSFAFLGESAVLTHYLLFSPQRKPQLTQYLKAINQGTPHDAAFAAAFDVSHEELESELREYASEKTFPSYRLPKANIAASYTTEKIPCWRGRISTGRALLRILDASDVRSSWFSMNDSNADPAAWRLARADAHLQQLEFREADELMDEVQAMPKLSAEWIVQLALQRIDGLKRKYNTSTAYSDEELDMLRATRTLLETPQAQSVDSAEKAYALAYVHLLLNERIAEAAEAAIHGVELAPENPEMALLAAKACELNKDMGNAAGALSIVASYAPTLRTRQVARRVIAEIDAHPGQTGFIAAAFPLISRGYLAPGPPDALLSGPALAEKDYSRACRTPEVPRDADLSTMPTFYPPRSNSRFPLLQPKYPPALREKKASGWVALAVLVTEDGRTSRALVTRSSGFPEMDESALDVIRGWRPSPATLDGRPACGWQSFSITYTWRTF